MQPSPYTHPPFPPPRRLYHPSDSSRTPEGSRRSPLGSGSTPRTSRSRPTVAWLMPPRVVALPTVLPTRGGAYTVVDRVNALLALSTPLPVRPDEVVLGGRPRFLERQVRQSSAPRTHHFLFRVDVTCVGEGALRVGGVTEPRWLPTLVKIVEY